MALIRTFTNKISCGSVRQNISFLIGLVVWLPNSIVRLCSVVWSGSVIQFCLVWFGSSVKFNKFGLVVRLSLVQKFD